MRLGGSFRISLALLRFTLLLIAGSLVSCIASAATITFVDNDTLGFYNDSLSTVLDHTSPFNGTFLFPGADCTDGDPTINPAPEPDLSVADSILGQWLDKPPILNANWSGPQLIPSAWAINTETAIVYSLDAGMTGLSDMLVEVGVDNGFYMWLDGLYIYGAMAPGYTYPGEYEYSVSIGGLNPSTHFLQVLREDHGGGSGLNIRVTGTPNPIPEPATLLLLGLGGLSLLRRRRG